MSTPVSRTTSQPAPDRLVENRVAFGGRDVEFSMYSTYAPAERVELSVSNPLFCSMRAGKKVMHVEGADPFSFVAHESFIVPPDQSVYIDFPDASEEAPTECLTIEIDRDKVRRIVARLNESLPRSPDSGPWHYSSERHCHFSNTEALEQTLGTLMRLFEEDHPCRDDLIDISVEALVVRMLQTEARHLLMEKSNEQDAKNGLAAAVEYVKENLHRHIEVKELAEAACMSEPSVYRYFRNEFDMTPVQFINKERMKVARRLLSNPRYSVTEASYQLGFSSVSHFIHLFRRHVGTTPKQYQNARAA